MIQAPTNFSDDAAIALTNRRGGSFSDRLTLWDIKQASATETGFEVLLEEKDGGEQVDTRCGH